MTIGGVPPLINHGFFNPGLTLKIYGNIWSIWSYLIHIQWGMINQWHGPGKVSHWTSPRGHHKRCRATRRWFTRSGLAPRNPGQWRGFWGPQKKLVGGFNHLEKIWVRQWEGLSHILWKIKNVWNHQPEEVVMMSVWLGCDIEPGCELTQTIPGWSDCDDFVSVCLCFSWLGSDIGNLEHQFAGTKSPTSLLQHLSITWCTRRCAAVFKSGRGEENSPNCWLKSRLCSRDILNTIGTSIVD